jgi:serine protease
MVDTATRVLVELVDGLDIPYDDSPEMHLAESLAGAWMAFAGQLGFPVQMTRLYSESDPDELAAMVEQARVDDPELPSLLSWYVIELPDDAPVDPEWFADALTALPFVASASVEMQAEGAVNRLNNIASIFQVYLNPGPVGIDAEFAWTKGGGDGAGVRFAVIDETLVDAGHRDLAGPNLTVVHAPPASLFTSPIAAVSHGTAALGIMYAQDNTVDCVGIVPNARAFYASAVWPPSAPGGKPHVSVAKSLVAVRPHLRAGDVVCIPMQGRVVRGGTVIGLFPAEAARENHVAIRTMTGLRIGVVEAAGNGGRNLDQVVPGLMPLDTAHPGFKDTGAIMVAAGQFVPFNPSAPMRRRQNSNFGSRIDCFAMGNDIFTLAPTASVLPLAPPLRNDFADTSGATPIVAGAAVALQGMRRRAFGGQPLLPIQLRQELSHPTNIACDPSNGDIRVMPNLRTIATALGIP